MMDIRDHLLLFISVAICGPLDVAPGVSGWLYSAFAVITLEMLINFYLSTSLKKKTSSLGMILLKRIHKTLDCPDLESAVLGDMPI